MTKQNQNHPCQRATSHGPASGIPLRSAALTIALGLLGLQGSSIAEDGAKPAAAPQTPAPKVDGPAKPAVIRPAELVSKGSAKAMADKDRHVLESMKDMSSEQLRELGEVYMRLGNRPMTNAVVAELLRRDKKDAQAIQIATNMREETEAPDDPEATHAQDLVARGHCAEAARILHELKARKYRGRPFRYQQDLAYALLEAGDEEAAKAAFKELLGNPLMSREARLDAQRSLSEMALEALSKNGEKALTSRDARRAMLVANQLLARNPNDPDGVALKAAALGLQGKSKQAIDYLLTLKAECKTATFPHQKALADALYEAKDFVGARSAYQTILDDSKASAEDKSDSRARMKDLNRDELILAGELALKHRDLAAAEGIAEKLEARERNHPDVLTFRAAIFTKQRRFGEALALLEHAQSIPAKSGTVFTANAELAEAYMNNYKWEKAAAQYAIAEEDGTLEKVDRFEAARLGREMRARYRPTITSTYEAQSESEGTYWHNSSEYSTRLLGAGHQLIFRSEWDQIELSDERLVKRRDTFRYQAELAYRRVISHGFFGEVSVGGSDEDVVYGAHVGQYEGPGFAWGVQFRGNDRATDTLQLMSINGRQDALTIYAKTNFSRKFSLDAYFTLRQVSAGGFDLGEGWNMGMEASYALIEEKGSRPQVELTYFNEIQRFNSNKLSDSFRKQFGRKGVDLGGLELIEDKIHRHGLILTVSKQLTPRVNGYVYGGASYEFEGGELELRAGAGLEAQLRKNTTLNVGIDYTSSGTAGNRGSEVLGATVGIRMSF